MIGLIAQADPSGTQIPFWEYVGQAAPLVLLALGFFAILGLEIAGGRRTREAGAWIVPGTLGLALLLIGARLAAIWVPPVGAAEQAALDPGHRGFTLLFFAGAYNLHPFHLVGQAVVLLAALYTACLSIPFFRGAGELHHRGEYNALLLLMPLGAMLMISGANLMVCFIGLEILSLSLYVLCAIRARDRRGVEAGLKYFLLGAFAAAFFVFGMALVYAGRGSIDLPALILQWDTPAQVEGLAAVGGAMIFTALLFKGSLFPFHMWTPDVYQGAPTPVTALMSTGTKTAAFVLMIAAIRFLPVELKPAVPFVAVLTMAAGNFGALRQVDLKRMLAYSGIAHAGYLLVGINSLTAAGGYTGDARIVIRFILFYLVTYVLANLGAFGVIAFLERKDRRAVTLERISGLGRTRPWAAGLLTLFLLSLGGIPPTAGFAGKLLLFSQAIRQGFHLLAAAGLLLSAVSLYYYLKVVVWLYMKPAPEGEEGGLPRPALLTTLPLGLSAAGVLVLGVFWNLLLNALWGVNS